MGSNKTTETPKINWITIGKHLRMSSGGAGAATDEAMQKKLKKLQKERDNLLGQVINMASFNYAREPDFVRDRNKLNDTLDEVANLKRLAQSQVNRIKATLGKARDKVNNEAQVLEEKSEQLIRDGLNGNIEFEDFVGRYKNMRRKANRKGIIAEKLTNEMGNIGNTAIGDSTSTNTSISAKTKNNTTANQQNSPTPTPRLRKRMSLLT